MASESCRVLALHFSDPHGYYTFRRGDRKTDGYHQLSRALISFLNSDYSDVITSNIVNLVPMNLVQFNPND